MRGQIILEVSKLINSNPLTNLLIIGLRGRVATDVLTTITKSLVSEQYPAQQLSIPKICSASSSFRRITAVRYPQRVWEYP